jgi:hypothetical protein
MLMNKWLNLKEMKSPSGHNGLKLSMSKKGAIIQKNTCLLMVSIEVRKYFQLEQDERTIVGQEILGLHL